MAEGCLGVFHKDCLCIFCVCVSGFYVTLQGYTGQGLHQVNLQGSW